MDFAKEINDVVRKSMNYRNLSGNYEESVAYSESLCNDLADKIQALVEGEAGETKKPCEHLKHEHMVLAGEWMYRCLDCGHVCTEMPNK